MSSCQSARICRLTEPDSALICSWQYPEWCKTDPATAREIDADDNTAWMIGWNLDLILIVEVCADGTHLHRTSKPRTVTLPMAVVALAEAEAMFVFVLTVNEIWHPFHRLCSDDLRWLPEDGTRRPSPVTLMDFYPASTDAEKLTESEVTYIQLALRRSPSRSHRATIQPNVQTRTQLLGKSLVPHERTRTTATSGLSSAIWLTKPSTSSTMTKHPGCLFRFQWKEAAGIILEYFVQLPRCDPGGFLVCGWRPFSRNGHSAIWHVMVRCCYVQVH